MVEMTELEMMARVAAHPLVMRYRGMVTAYRKQMVDQYGEGFDGEWEDTTIPDPRGFTVMTEAQRKEYNSLHSRCSRVRSSVRRTMFPNS